MLQVGLMTLGGRIEFHAADFVEDEWPTVLANALLGVERWTAGNKAHPKHNAEHQRKGERKAEENAGKIQCPFPFKLSRSGSGVARGFQLWWRAFKTYEFEIAVWIGIVRKGSLEKGGCAFEGGNLLFGGVFENSSVHGGASGGVGGWWGEFGLVAGLQPGES